jgi:hypothetical protein
VGRIRKSNTKTKDSRARGVGNKILVFVESEEET